MGKRGARRTSDRARRGPGRDDDKVRTSRRGRDDDEVRTSRRGRDKGSVGTSRRGRPPWRPKLIGSGGSRSSGADAAGALHERVERIRLALYDLYGDLEYFKSSPPEHRELLRRSLDWSDVGHITSLVRSLAEEDRFTDWLRFNGMLNGAVGTRAPAGRRGPALTQAIAREKSA